MPIRRFRRPMRPRRRVMRRPRFRRSRIPRPVGKFRKLMVPRSFRQGYNVGVVTIPTANVPGLGPTFNYVFTIASLPNLGDFQGLFDEYKINRIKLEFTPSDVVNAGSGNIPVVYSVIDFDDTNAIGSINQAMEYESCTKNLCTKYFKKYWTPRVSRTIFPYSGFQITQAAVTAGIVVPSGSIRACWLNLNNNSTGVYHYGVKGVVYYPTATGQPFSYMVDVTYYFQLRLIQ